MSGLGRTTAAWLHSCQEAREAVPFEWDEDSAAAQPLTEEVALEKATDECMSVASGLAFQIGHLCDLTDDAREPVDLNTLYSDQFDPDDANSGRLLVMLFEGSPENSAAALYVLRDRIKDAMQSDIKTRADELLRADAKQWEAA